MWGNDDANRESDENNNGDVGIFLQGTEYVLDIVQLDICRYCLGMKFDMMMS